MHGAALPGGILAVGGYGGLLLLLEPLHVPVRSMGRSMGQIDPSIVLMGLTLGTVDMQQLLVAE